jgi:hypothetical protein
MTHHGAKITMPVCSEGDCLFIPNSLWLDRREDRELRTPKEYEKGGREFFEWLRNNVPWGMLDGVIAAAVAWHSEDNPEQSATWRARAEKLGHQLDTIRSVLKGIDNE